MHHMIPQLVYRVQKAHTLPFHAAMPKRAIKNKPLPLPFVDSFEAETMCRHAYLKSHPQQPQLRNFVPKSLFSSDGTSLMGDAHPEILDRLWGTNCMINPRHAVWQVPSKAVFVAMYHLTAGAAACAELPPGVFAFGGSITASLAVPAFDDEGHRIDFQSLHDAGRAIGNHLASARFWQKIRGGVMLPQRLIGCIEEFAGFGKANLARAVQNIFAGHGVVVDDTNHDDWDETFGRDKNWSWWLTAQGCAPYARTDVDFYVTGDSLEQASERAEALRVELKEVLGEHTAVRTPNTLTLCPGFPERQFQIVLTAHRDLSSVMLFADLDSTAVGFDGRRVWGSGRFLRAVREGVNIVPVGMWELRSDTVGRAAKYVRRGFGVCLGSRKHWTEYPNAVRQETCWIARMKPRYFTADSSNPMEVLLQLKSNTAYNEYKIPRGPGVTPEIVEFFFIQHGAETRLLDAELPLQSEWRLNRKPEDWVVWNYV